MPSLRVEYSPSNRATCGLKECGKKILKNELRIGVKLIMPYGDGVETWKWRHLCCFTERQLDNARASGDIDNIEGEDKLASVDKQLVAEMRKGELIGKTEIIGRVSEAASSTNTDNSKKSQSKTKATSAATKAKTSKSQKAETTSDKGNAKSAKSKSSRASRTSAVDLAEGAFDENRMLHESDADSASTEEYEVEVQKIICRPSCPFKTDCFRTNPEHYREYLHGDERDEIYKPVQEPVQWRPVIVGHK